jgi:3-hydroxyacyl-CoA dehydrogenase
MGAAIAAHVANADVPVLLLDVPPAEGGDRDALASAAVARMLKADPAPFMHAGAARLIEVGNTEDDLGRLSACDWIIEAIVERLDIKQALYRRLQQVRRPGTAVSSNTSTIPLARLVEGLGEAFSRDFLITHFFNPPRYMRLLELVTGPATDPDLAARVTHFVDHKLGKTVVRCHDSPGFIANRLGVYWLQLGVVEAMDLGLTVEEADAVMGKPLGIPNTGVFGLLDAAHHREPRRRVARRRSVPCGEPRHSADPPSGRNGLYRPQGEGRVLPPGSCERARQGGG